MSAKTIQKNQIYICNWSKKLSGLWNLCGWPPPHFEKSLHFLKASISDNCNIVISDVSDERKTYYFAIFLYQFLLSEPFLTIAKCSHPESAQLTKTKAEKAKKKLTEAKSAEEEEREAFCQRRDERIHNSPPQVAGVVVVVVGVAC